MGVRWDAGRLFGRALMGAASSGRNEGPVGSWCSGGGSGFVGDGRPSDESLDDGLRGGCEMVG